MDAENKKHPVISAVIFVGAGLSIASVAFAANDTTRPDYDGSAIFARPVVGTVSSVHGSTLTLFIAASSTAVVTTYTVDDSGSKVVKDAATASLSSIAVGDEIAVFGEAGDGRIIAKLIIDGWTPHLPNAPPAV